MRLACLLVVVLSLSAWSAGAPAILPDRPNTIAFAPAEARFVRLVIHESRGGEPCIDEIELYSTEGGGNVALAAGGAKASASSCLAGYAIHQVAHLNDGLYGNDHSWIAAGTEEEWAQIELPRPVTISRVVFSRDRRGRYADRMPFALEVQLSTDGKTWRTVASVNPRPIAAIVKPPGASGPAPYGELLRYAFACEERSYLKTGSTDPTARVLELLESLVGRLEKRSIDVSVERDELRSLRQRHRAYVQAGESNPKLELELFHAARFAKRRLLFRDPELAAIQKILFIKRHPYLPSHNYSDLLDAQGPGGGGIFVLSIPRSGGRLEPERSALTPLFDAREGVVRDLAVDFDLSAIYFGYRPSKSDYFHLYGMKVDGSGAKRLTDGPFHDFYPCPLPDGGLAFISTRCKARFLCWRPQAYTLFRMDADGGNVRALSHANLSEWAPSLMADGRILWTRSEYQDKGADFGHTLWAVRPDGSHPELIFGNNTNFCYAGAREVPGSRLLATTLISHGGDLNGPIALIDPSRGRFDPTLVTNLTPDSPPHFHMSWAMRECFRDPVPINEEYILCSHAADDRFGLYVIDRHGNRELLFLDPGIGSMCPLPLRPTPRPPVLAAANVSDEAAGQEGTFYIADVYQGLGPNIRRGEVKHIRVCQELRSSLERLPGGDYRADHEPFMDFYATPTHKVAGPYGWPTYVAKADLGDAPVEADGSACFRAPSGRTLYFQVLDEDYNELQRMRSVVQLQPGEQRGCIGCHENRASAAPSRTHPAALRRPPSALRPAPWGAGPFSYEAIVQPVLDAHCTACHGASDKGKIDLTAALDAEKIPASYRTLIERGLVHYFDCQWGQEHHKADAGTFGTLKSRLMPFLEASHYGVKLTAEDKRRIKTWVDLNCPLWPDYVYRQDRRPLQAAQAAGKPVP